MPFGPAADEGIATRKDRGPMLSRILRTCRANQPRRGRSVCRVLPTLRIPTRRTALQSPRVDQLSTLLGNHRDFVFSVSHQPQRAARPHAAAPLHGPAMKVLGAPLTTPSSGQRPQTAHAARPLRTAEVFQGTLRPGPTGRGIGRRRVAQLRRARSKGAPQSQTLACPTRCVSTAVTFCATQAEKFAAVNSDAPALRVLRGQSLTTKHTGTSSWI